MSELVKIVVNEQPVRICKVSQSYLVVTDKSQALGGVSGNVTIDASLGNVVSLVRNGAITLSLTGSAGAGEVCVLTLVVMAGTSNADITWPDTVLWDHGAKPMLTNSGIDMFNLFQFNGVDCWYGTVVGQDFQVPIS